MADFDWLRMLIPAVFYLGCIYLLLGWIPENTES
ncbi:hypothetical protein AmaxDRAFT_1437 [Limnospira maxima CS-328]|uniref:Uncharacterized protein n=1 Tax=Limnospira maxima CS-328 TaxID=513049 RepID=B5VY45_LIMMA|nr:hypothetical protein AmaxDRAFT_1437 [Limnospira maxima CS-328]UWU47440.1 hypothetical protein APLC1_2202 [Arthrospira platensis C1]